ncbi:hypothetical protein ACJX0J_034386, partial [Zea mays]
IILICLSLVVGLYRFGSGSFEVARVALDPCLDNGHVAGFQCLVQSLVACDGRIGIQENVIILLRTGF